MKGERRVYPQSCVSAYCGKYGDSCNKECRYFNKLQEFKKWRDETNAICADHIWSPNVYIAQK